MTWDIRSFMPNRISGQIALVIIASVAVIHLVLTATFLLNRPDHHPEPPSEPLATLVQVIDASPAESRDGLVATMAGAFPSLALALADRVPGPPETDRAAEAFGQVGHLAHRLGPRYRVVALAADSASGDAAGKVAIALNGGRVLTARLSPPPPAPPFGPVSVTLLSFAISISLLGLWAAHALTEPLRRFARAAENFTPYSEIASLPVKGPVEIRVAARALNRLRERIKSLIDDRTRMLAAVGHDLRTPITRLRLWCEFVEDETVRTQMRNELNQMSAMVDNVVNFLRDGRSGEQETMLDFATSLQAICDQFTDVGGLVRYHGPDHLVIRAKATELHRAVANLVENGVRHGREVDVRLTPTAGSVVVTVEDDGPGIPDSDKGAMLQPFVRGDAARGMNDKGGFGLGLSIARAAIEAHGGTIALLDRRPSGLIAKLTLPPSVTEPGNLGQAPAQTAA